MSVELLSAPELPPVWAFDGPPQAYFDIPLYPFGLPGCYRVTYHSIRMIYGSFEAAAKDKACEVLLAAIVQKLVELGGGTIYWRRRPYLYEEITVKAGMRLGTVPELPKAWWDAAIAMAVGASAILVSEGG